MTEPKENEIPDHCSEQPKNVKLMTAVQAVNVAMNGRI